MGRTWGKTVKLSGPGMQPRFMKARVSKSRKSRPNLGKPKKIRPEVKRYDQSPNGATVPSTGTLVQLNQIAQGTGDSQRVGNRVYLRYLRFAAAIVQNPTTYTSGTVRFLIFVDTEGNPANPPTLANVLEFDTAGNGLVSPIDSDYTQRYTVLMDKRISVSATGPEELTFKKFRKLNVISSWSGSSATAYDKHSIWLLMVSGVPADGPSVIYSSRIAFVDP